MTLITHNKVLSCKYSKQCETYSNRMKTSRVSFLIVYFLLELQSIHTDSVIAKYFSESCGIVDSVGIYQTKAKIYDTPWMAAVRFYNNGIEFQSLSL